MELLLTNQLPIKTNHSSFSEKFIEKLNHSEKISMASGYISSDSLVELKWIIENHKKPYVDLVIGMHFFEGITRQQYQAAISLNHTLNINGLGSVKISNKLKFHGKLYSFKDFNKLESCIIGSSNLSNILTTSRNYEADLFIEDEKINSEINGFIENLILKASIPINEWCPTEFIEHNRLLEDLDDVEKINFTELEQIRREKNKIKFHLPLKASCNHRKSNLNVYFGKGRINSRTGYEIPRHWYEVELIVPKKITSSSLYPPSEHTLIIYTDDGWKFKCIINGQNKKNFRSKNCLTTLGRWLKGRLENNGALKTGELVTEETLLKYGRDTITLEGTTNPDIWLLDFGVNHEQ